MDQEPGLTRTLLAQKLGVSYNTLKHSLENPGAVLSIDPLLMLGQAFPHWNMAYLLTGEGELIRPVETAPEPEPTPTERVGYWLAKRQQLVMERQNLKGEAWGRYTPVVQQWTEELLAENDRLRAEFTGAGA